MRRTDGVVLLVLLSLVTPGGGAGAEGNSGQFGAQARANALSLLTVLAVQQGISSLPPTSGQSFVYPFDLELGTYVQSPVLGPTIFRAADTIGTHNLSLRVGVSYFELGESFGPIGYLLEDPRGLFVIGLGAQANVNVTVMNLSATYGLTSWLELLFNLPITVVQANASQIASTSITDSTLPASDALVDGAFTSTSPTDPKLRALVIRALIGQYKRRISSACDLGPNDCLKYRSDSFESLGFDFNEGTHAGVGRISLGGKALLYSNSWVHTAFMAEFFAPSPSEAEFSGSDTPAIFPRGILTVPATDWLSFHGDIGYDYDFDESALRRLAWTAGASVPRERFEFDLGIAGSEYDTPVRWTPTVVAPAQVGTPGSIMSALGDNQVGDDFIDFVGGLKVRLAERWVLSGAVDVPLNNQGFRPAALGTLALEYYVQGG